MPGHHGAFGEDAFGRFAERTARFFGTPQYIIGRTIVVAIWILVNVPRSRTRSGSTPGRSSS